MTPRLDYYKIVLYYPSLYNRKKYSLIKEKLFIITYTPNILYQFWETNADTVQRLVGPVIFERLAKIFFLPMDAEKYVPRSETASLRPSTEFYTTEQRVASVSSFLFGIFNSVLRCQGDSKCEVSYFNENNMKPKYIHLNPTELSLVQPPASVSPIST